MVTAPKQSKEIQKKEKVNQPLFSNFKSAQLVLERLSLNKTLHYYIGH